MLVIIVKTNAPDISSEVRLVAIAKNDGDDSASIERWSVEIVSLHSLPLMRTPSKTTHSTGFLRDVYLHSSTNRPTFSGHNLSTVSQP